MKASSESQWGGDWPLNKWNTSAMNDLRKRDAAKAVAGTGSKLPEKFSRNSSSR